MKLILIQHVCEDTSELCDACHRSGTDPSPSVELKERAIVMRESSVVMGHLIYSQKGR